MKKKSNDLFCIFLIIFFLIIIVFSTYIKFTTKEATNEITNENSDTIENTTIKKSLHCKLIYTDEENIKAKIKEEIIIKFNDLNEPINQTETKTYNFDTINDYNNYKNNLTDEENIKYEENNMQIIIENYNDYTKPYNSNNETDFRNETYTQIEKYFLNKEYTCE